MLPVTVADKIGMSGNNSDDNTKPTLSWMLSPYDRYRIEQAWQNQLLRLPKKKDESQGGPVNASGTVDPDKNATNGASEAVKIIPLEKLDTIFEFQN